MSIITHKQHLILDLVSVAVFALAPTVLGLDGASAAISYLLAVVHLAMTLMTRGLPGSMAKLVPFPLHGLVEAVVGVLLGVIAWLAFATTAQLFFLVMGLVILLVFILTGYQPADE